MSTDDTDRRAKRLTRCHCGETASAATDKYGNPACMAHKADPKPPPLANPEPFAPEAVATWEKMQNEAARRDMVGAVRVNVVGVDESGRKPKGAEDWYYREPRATPDEHHDQAIVVGHGDSARLMWQQATPIHARNAPFADPKTAKRVARELSDAASAREYFRMSALHVADQVAGVPTAELAVLGGLSEAGLQRRIRKARKASRR